MNNESTDAILLAWEAKQPVAITGDPLWKLNCYRESLFLVDRVRDDIKGFGPATDDGRGKDQLRTAVGSIAANIGEGYGRPGTADRMRFLSFALGSTREALGWYVALRPSPDDPVAMDRIERLARIRRMLLGLMTRLKEKGGRKFDSW